MVFFQKSFRNSRYDHVTMMHEKIYFILVYTSPRLGLHSAKRVCIRSFSGPYFPTFGPHSRISERYEVSLRIQPECGKIWTRKTPNTDTVTHDSVTSRASYKGFNQLQF